MNLLQLHYFRVVAECEHVSKAAEKLNISQPSLTATIHRLEDELNVPLFTRQGRGLTLTQYGKIWLKYVRKVFDTLDDGKEELLKAKNIFETTVLISFRSASMLAADIVSEIISLNPEIRITLTSDSSKSHLSVSCSWRNDCEKNQITLLREILKIALPPNHPLEEKEILTLNEIASLKFIMPTSDNPIHDVISHYLDVMNVRVNAVMHVQNTDLLCSLVKEKGYAAFIPTLTWEKFHVKNVTLHSAENFTMNKYVRLIFREQDRENTAVKICRDVITKYFAAVQKELQNNS